MNITRTSQRIKELSQIVSLCKEKKIDVATLLVVSVHKQELLLFKNLSFVKAYKVSTAEKGIGQVENSAQTPTGLHTILEKIGEGQDPFTIFKSRKPHEEAFQENHEDRQIVGRILWLKGEEEGLNSGKNAQNQIVDSYKRYIYIHGTNQIDKIGTASSAGCVCLHPHEMVELYGLVQEGAPVYILDPFRFEN